MFPNRAKTFFQLYDEKTRKYEEKSATPEQYQALGKAFNLYITEAETTQKLGNIFDNQIKTEQGDSVIGKYELLGHEEREKLEEQEQQVSIALFLVQEQGKKASLAKQREENLKFYGNLGIFLLIINMFVPEEEQILTSNDFYLVPTEERNKPSEERKEIIFVPVNVNNFHHSLLVYKKSNDTFYHYDSLGGYNFKFIKDNNINDDELREAKCPQQSGDGWGSCGIYPPVIISILLKRHEDNLLTDQLETDGLKSINMVTERTLAIIKPDIIQKSLIGEIISIWEAKGLRVIKMKMTQLTPQQAATFYGEHREKVFFHEMVNFMCSAPVVIVCLQGENAIRINREIMGATNPALAQKATIRKIFGTSITANAVHGSDRPVWVEGKELTEFFQEIVNEAKRVGGAFPDANQLEVFLDWAKAMQAKEFSEIRAKIIQQEREIEMNCQHIESMLTREENSTIEKEEISEPTPLNPGSPIGEEENYETSPNPDGPEPTAN
ncbi:13800_t:CDS:2, partial [Racocetra persica]